MRCSENFSSLMAFYLSGFFFWATSSDVTGAPSSLPRGLRMQLCTTTERKAKARRNYGEWRVIVKRADSV